MAAELVQVLFRLAAGYAHDSATYAGAALRAGLATPFMTMHLVAFGVAATLVGTWLPAAPYPSGLLEAVAAAYALAVGAAIVLGDGGTRRAILACLLLAVGGYGIIAVGRALIMPQALSMIAPAAATTRYHYAPPVPLVVAACLALGVAGRALSTLPSWAGNVALVVWIAALALPPYFRPPVIDHYDAERQEVAAMRAAVANQVAQAPPGAPVYIANRRMPPVNYFTPMESFPGWAGLFVVYFPDNHVDGHAVHFIEARSARVALARRRAWTRTADLLVTRAEAAAASPADS